jgi:hypothetical protein
VKAGYKTVGCGNLLTSWLFLFSFVFLITLVFLNLFVAIILNGYFETRNDIKQEINKEIIDEFKSAWANLDPNATGMIKMK